MDDAVAQRLSDKIAHVRHVWGNGFSFRKEAHVQ